MTLIPLDLYQMIVLALLFAPLGFLAIMEIATHIRWMRERRARRHHPTNKQWR